MTIPHYVNEHQSDIRAIKPGWYGMESNGKLSSGPFPNQEECLTGITQPRSNSQEHRPGGTRPTILKLSPTRRATRKRPWTTWLTRKLLWTLGTRRRGREREPHNRAKSKQRRRPRACVVWHRDRYRRSPGR